MQCNATWPAKILARLEAEGFVVLGLKMAYLSKQDAERFYAVHRERPFFESLTSYMASGASYSHPP